MRPLVALIFIVGFVGCAGGHPDSAYQVWLTCNRAAEPGLPALERSQLTASAVSALDECVAKGSATIRGSAETNKFPRGNEFTWENRTVSAMTVVP